MSAVLGIDLGTTKSAVGVWDGRKPRILPSESGSQSIPSLVMVTPDEEIYAGLRAARHPDRYNSKNITISSVKRMIGSKGETGWGWWKSYPQEVSSFILSELRQQAETVLESEANQAVIAIPSHFDEAQRRATKEAATIAGIEVLRLLNEATAAILAYGIARQKEETVVVFDLGGGTLDVSVAEIGGGVFEVKTIEGESSLGGDDFTQVIVDYVTDRVRKENGSEVASDAAHILMLREAADRAKIELSSGQSTTIHIPGFLSCRSKHSDLLVEISRDTFQTLCKPLLDRAIYLLRRALNSSGAEKPDASLLLGGSSRIPILRQRVRAELNIEPFTGVDPETCVAQGAIIQAGIIAGGIQDVVLLDVMPSSYGIAISGGVFSPMISRGTTVPTKHSEIFTTMADNQGKIEIDLYNGERNMCADNIYVGHIDLDGIPPAPKGIPQIEVTFDADPNMIVRATAKDLGTGKKQEVTIRSPFGLTQVQVNMMAKRLSRWKDRKRVLDALPRATAIQQRISELLWRDRKLLDHDEIGILEARVGDLALATQNTEQGEDLLEVIAISGETVETIATQVQRRRDILEERDRLTKRINQINTMVLGPLSADRDTLMHGVALLTEYEAQGAAATEVSNLIASIRLSYCGLVGKLVVSLLSQLQNLKEFRAAIRSPEGGCAEGVNAFPVSVLVQLQPVRVLRSIVTEETEYADDICALVGDAVAEDHDLAAVWFLVCQACDWRGRTRPPVGHPIDQHLTDCCILVLLDILDSELSSSRRKVAAETLTRFLLPQAHFGRLVRAVLREADEGTRNCLLSQIDRQPVSAIAEWFMDSDTETRASVRSCMPILVRLCGSPDELCRDFALQTLVDSGTSLAWNALEALMSDSNDTLRAAAYRAAFAATNTEPLMSSAIVKALRDRSARIRLMGMKIATSNPKLVGVDTMLEQVQANSPKEIRANAAGLLAQYYGAQGQLALLAVALSSKEKEIRGLAIESVQARREHLDGDIKRLLALTYKCIEAKKKLNLVDRLYCWYLLKRRPAIRALVALLTAHTSRGE